VKQVKGVDRRSLASPSVTDIPLSIHTGPLDYVLIGDRSPVRRSQTFFSRFIGGPTGLRVDQRPAARLTVKRQHFLESSRPRDYVLIGDRPPRPDCQKTLFFGIFAPSGQEVTRKRALGHLDTTSMVGKRADPRGSFDPVRVEIAQERISGRGIDCDQQTP
jgi:hypothetical protein